MQDLSEKFMSVVHKLLRDIRIIDSFDKVVFAVDWVVSRTVLCPELCRVQNRVVSSNVSQLFTCELVNNVWNRWRKVLNVRIGLKWPCVVDMMLQSSY